MLSVIQLLIIANNVLERMWKKWPWASLRWKYSLGFSWKNLAQLRTSQWDNLLPGSGSNWAHPKQTPKRYSLSL